MSKLANSPFCVWFDCKMRTFKTRAAAERFAKGRAGRIGVWSDAEGWWVEEKPLDASLEGRSPPTHEE